MAALATGPTLALLILAAACQVAPERSASEPAYDLILAGGQVDPVELLALTDTRLERLDRDFTPDELARFGDLLGR